MTLLSIVIPTRNRAELAQKSAACVLAQDFDDFELLILDNSDDPELSKAVFDDVRCNVVSSKRVLAMRDNWERALDLSSGQYIMLLSDKDMLLPGSLERIAEAIRSTSADMINFRKAGYSNDGTTGSFIQYCSGKTTESSGEPVLRAWFREVRHFHDAPMIYNSAVRRSVLVDLKQDKGRFFVGTAPDVCSGVLLLSKLGKYHLLDQPLVLSWFGKWSIGMAANQGATGAAAAFIAEYGSDPITNSGLVMGVIGSVAETLLECKRQFPDLLASFELAWPNYVRSVLRDLYARDEKGMETRSAREFLRETRGKPYSRLDMLVGELHFNWEKSRWRATLEQQIMRVISRLNRPAVEAAASRATRPGIGSVSCDESFVTSYLANRSHGQSFRDVPCFLLSPSMTFDDMWSLVITINERLSLEATSQ